MDIKAFKEKYEHKPVAENLNNVSKQPLVSVCVQTYQHVDFIEACLEGILKQETNFEFEILLGEDASTDGTRELCEKYAKQYPDKIRLFLHHRENNIKIGGSPTGRFNFVYNLFSARGQYIALCEGDDYWTDPLKLQKQVDFLEDHEDYGICFHSVKIKDEIKSVLEQDSFTRDVNLTTNSKDLALGNYIHTTSVVIRNNFVTPEWLFLSPIGDWALYMIAIQNKKIKKLNDIMAIYRVHQNGIWSLKSKEYRMKNMLTAYELVRKHIHFDKQITDVLDEKINNYKKFLKRGEYKNEGNFLVSSKKIIKRIVKSIFKFK